jgi:MFS family permease
MDQTVERGKLFESLAYEGAKTYFLGLLLSMVGTWMQSIALSWLIVKVLGGSGRELGWLAIAQFGPMLVFGSWAGALSDRIDKRRLMIYTQTILGICACTLGVLTVTDHITLPIVLMISSLGGLANAFDTPVRRALVGDLVPKEVVPNAMSLNTSVITSSRFFGMMLGGFLTKWFGPGACFLINGVSYLAMISAIYSLKTRSHATIATTNAGVRHAFRHIINTPTLLVAMAATALIATVTFNYTLTYPLLVEGVFAADADSLGIVLGVASIGSFTGSILSARRRTPSLFVFLMGCLTMGVSGIAVGLAPSLLWCALFSIPLAGGGGLLMAQLSGLLTWLSPSAMRGRVLALQSVVFIGSTPIGGPFVGWISDTFGPRWGMGVGGIAALVAGLGGLVYRSARIPAVAQLEVSEHLREVRVTASRSSTIDEMGGTRDEASFMGSKERDQTGNLFR